MLRETHEEPSTLPEVLVKDEKSVSQEVQTVSDSRLEPRELKGERYHVLPSCSADASLVFTLITV